MFLAVKYGIKTITLAKAPSTQRFLLFITINKKLVYLGELGAFARANSTNCD